MNQSNTFRLTPVVLPLVMVLISWPAYCQNSTTQSDSLVRSIRISFSRNDVKPDSLEREEIRKRNNELYRALRIDLFSVSGDNLSERETGYLSDRMKEVEHMLQEESVPKKLIHRNWVSSPQERQLLKLTSSSLLIRYELPPDFFAGNNSKRRRDALCMKDTIIKLENRIVLKYNLCNYIAGNNLPELRVFDLTASVVDPEAAHIIKENRKGHNVFSMFKYQFKNAGILPDIILIPVVDKNANYLVEYFNDSLKMWLEWQSDVSRLVKIDGKEYYPLTFLQEGYFRLSAMPRTQMFLLYVSAPMQLSFYDAVLVRDAWQSWPAEILNGGTAALFLLPVDYSTFNGRFSLLTIEKQIRYATEAPITQQLGKRYRIPEHLRGSVIIEGRNFRVPEYGYRLTDDFDAVKSVAIDNIK